MGKWKPTKENEYYWTVNMYSFLEVERMELLLYENGKPSAEDKGRIKLGNCFRTKAEAQSAKKKIKSILKGEME